MMSMTSSLWQIHQIKTTTTDTCLDKFPATGSWKVENYSTLQAKKHIWGRVRQSLALLACFLLFCSWQLMLSSAVPFVSVVWLLQQRNTKYFKHAPVYLEATTRGEKQGWTTEKCPWIHRLNWIHYGGTLVLIHKLKQSHLISEEQSTWKEQYCKSSPSVDSCEHLECYYLGY